MRLPGFIGGSYTAQSPAQNVQRLINGIIETDESGSGRTPAGLYGRPGLEEWATIGTGPIRCVLPAGSPTNNSERCFIVSGSHLYEVDSGAAYTDLGDVGNDSASTPVDMELNGSQLFIVSAGSAYLHDGVSLTPLSGAGLAAARRGAFLDNYFIASIPDARSYVISDLVDGSTWDPLDLAVKESHPDLIAAPIANGVDLWLFGEKSTEVHNNVGNPDFPFARNNSASQNVGTVGIYSPVRFAGTVAWVGVDGDGPPTAYIAQGYRGARVSTAGVERSWSAYSVISDTYSWTFTDQGHQFWVIVFPSVGATWVYDLTTKAWYEWAHWTGSAFTPFRGRCHGFVYGLHLVGDRTSGKVYRMSRDVYTDDGSPIAIQRILGHTAEGWKATIFHSVELIAQTGAVSHATVTVDYSLDSGENFIGARVMDLGAVGDFATRLQARRLGRSRDRVFRFSTTMAGPVAWLDAHIEMSPGDN